MELNDLGKDRKRLDRRARTIKKYLRTGLMAPESLFGSVLYDAVDSDERIWREYIELVPESMRAEFLEYSRSYLIPIDFSPPPVGSIGETVPEMLKEQAEENRRIVEARRPRYVRLLYLIEEVRGPSEGDSGRRAKEVVKNLVTETHDWHKGKDAVAFCTRWIRSLEDVSEQETVPSQPCFLQIIRGLLHTEEPAWRECIELVPEHRRPEFLEYCRSYLVPVDFMPDPGPIMPPLETLEEVETLKQNRRPRYIKLFQLIEEICGQTPGESEHEEREERKKTPTKWRKSQGHTDTRKSA